MSLNLHNNSIEIICQQLFENEINFNVENRILADCGVYCTNILQIPDSPWNGHRNLMGYWYSKRQTKLSKLQIKILQYLHQWYFSKSKPAYLKIKNLVSKIGSSRRSTIRAITRLVEREILIRLEYWSEKYKRFRSILLPNMHKSLKEKLIFNYQKRTHPLFQAIYNNISNLENKWSLPQKETVTGGSDRFFFNILKSLKNGNGYIYINILFTNYLCTKTPIAFNYKTSFYKLNTISQRKSSSISGINQCEPRNQSTNQGASDMQIKSATKPKRLILKIKGTSSCPTTISETIEILKKKNFDPESVPRPMMTDLLSYIQSKFSNGYFTSFDRPNDVDLPDVDLDDLFRIGFYSASEGAKKYRNKLFRMLMELIIDNRNLVDFTLIKATKQIISYWTACAKKNKDDRFSYTKHNPNLKSITGFKLYIGCMYHFYKTLDYNPDLPEQAIKDRIYMFTNAIKRIHGYAFMLGVPKKLSFDTVLLDPFEKGKFIQCLTLNDDQFFNQINQSKKVYQARPETEKSMNNFKQIFIDSFYEKNPQEGNKRFQQFKPKFAKFLETLIGRIEKYSNNGQMVELCGLKLTAETPQDLPVLFYYMDWMKKEIFSETVFKFDELFSLHNWVTFIKLYMRQERGYTNYWKIVDRK